MKNIDGFYQMLLDSLVDPFLFVDTDHVIRYMNKPAIEHYSKGADLIGTSIFDCHNELANQLIRKIFEQMLQGETERLITNNKKYRIYMRAVRDSSGKLMGYYERYEPPREQ